MTRYYGTAFGYVFIYHHNECKRHRYIENEDYDKLSNLKFLTDGIMKK